MTRGYRLSDDVPPERAPPGGYTMIFELPAFTPHAPHPAHRLAGTCIIIAISFRTRMSKYEVLGVSRSAPIQEIKSAYQAAALATHPDKQASLATEALKKQVRACI